MQLLTIEQRLRVFAAEALGGDETRFTGEQRNRLLALDHRVPGDFAAVQRQVNILGQVLQPDEVLRQREVEHRVQPDVRQRRGIGFSH